MRLWARIWSYNPDGSRQNPQPTGFPYWTAVTTAPNGDSSMIYLVLLIQNLLLNLNESPFYADRGLPAHQSVVQQVAPDTYVNLTQQRFAVYFANLVVTRLPGLTPTYRIVATTLQGAQINAVVPQ